MRMLHVAVAALLLGAASARPAGPAPTWSAPAEVGQEWIGRRPPEWTFDRWVGSGPRSLSSLRGHVVLVRWWTEGCPYCAATLPGLEQLRETEAARGLVVIGAFHPKPPRRVSDAHVKSVAKRLGFRGPIAVDERWSTLDRWWLDRGAGHDWTSVTFLLDRDGIVRWVHGGGEFHASDDPEHAACDASWHGLEQAIARALATPVGHAAG